VANVQFGGLITGLDTNALIQGLVQAEQRSITILQTQKVRFQAQDGILASVVKSLGDLKSAAQGLSLSTDFHKKTAASSDSTVLTSSADATALEGAYQIVVDRLAKAQSIRSSTFSTATAAIGMGTLSITVDGKATPVTIDATNNTIDGLKTAINSSGAAVTASIVNVGTDSDPDYRLIVQSKKTGTENAATISGSLAGGADPFVTGGEIVQAAANAIFSVNGQSITRSSNTISDALPGVTLALVKEGDRDGAVESTDATANVTVSVDTTAVKAAMQKLVDTYNGVNKTINAQFTLDPNTERQGALAGDSSLRNVMARLRQELSRSGGIGAGIKFISDIGISFQKDGSLTIDDGKLTSALKENPDGVSDLFVIVENGLGKRIPDTVDDFVSSVSGTLTFRRKGINTSIEQIDKKVVREQERIAALQKRLTQQFSALEEMVSQLKSQGDFLAQQLSALSQSR
jgi:flagellar hook-associated protein 2